MLDFCPNQTVLCEIRKNVAILTLNRPDVHNVVDDRVMLDLESALDKIESESEVRTVIVTGSGDRTFCAGSDLRYFARLKDPDRVAGDCRWMQTLLQRLYEGPRVVIAAINGSAYGGGCELMTACHFRIAADQASFQFRQTAMGVVTGWGGGPRLFDLLGRQKALKLLLTGERIDAGKARDLGLLDNVFPRDRVLSEALNMADGIGQGAPEAVAGFLELARFADRRDPAPILEKETQLFVACWQKPWFGKALDRFLNHRRPLS